MFYLFILFHCLRIISLGDVRTNQIMTLTSLHIIFLRHHNKLATALAAINPYWNDETLYQEY